MAPNQRFAAEKIMEKIWQKNTLVGKLNSRFALAPATSFTTEGESNRKGNSICQAFKRRGTDWLTFQGGQIGFPEFTLDLAIPAFGKSLKR